MKKILLPLSLMVVVLATSCNTTRKLYEAQQYDQVIQREAPKVCEGRINPNMIGLIAASYHRANQADHERIQALKASGQPEVWPEIYERFCSMKGRNQALACFPKQVKNDIQYTTLQLDEELKAAQNKAEAYLTAKISQTLDGTQPDLEEIDRMIRRLQDLNPENTRLNEFKVRSLAKRYGDLSRIMHVDVVKQQVSPNRDETVTFKESANGLTASVTDHTLSKTANAQGKVRFIDPKSKRLLLSVPFDVSSKFNATYTQVEGPTEACSEQTLERLRQAPVPFPTDQSLLEDALRQLNESFSQWIQ
jgi:hypothetical protein